MEIQTRDFRIEDYDAAVELWNRVEGLDVAEGDDRATIERFLQRNPQLSRIAADGNKIIGAVLCGHDGRRGYIYHLAIDPAYEGRGLGRRLIGECLDGLERAGLERANILVAKDNPRGLQFWRRCGWEDLEGAAPLGRDVSERLKVSQRALTFRFGAATTRQAILFRREYTERLVHISLTAAGNGNNLLASCWRIFDTVIFRFRLFNPGRENSIDFLWTLSVNERRLRRGGRISTDP